ncbi:unnamed protein product [Mytilus coruscus]|uniref:Uncharacterized protein n=1 Tax=Mytilus coruscus TaxID=42192 RepID=A0A6J8AVJ5_MYTCO|nr:unnamed protein product [Mytilus coruscus]
MKYELLQNKGPPEYGRNTAENPNPCKCKNSDTGQMRREIESQLRQEVQTQLLEIRVNKIENYPASTCKSKNQQPVVNSANQLPTQSMEHQSIHRAEATCGIRNIPNRQFLLLPLYIQSNSKPVLSNRAPAAERKQAIPHIGNNEKNSTHLSNTILEIRRSPIHPDITQEEIEMERTNTQC